jgi:hypothetical protein
VQLIERTLLDAVTPVEDVLVEDTSDDEEVVSHVTVDPVFLITIKDTPHFLRPRSTQKPPQQMEDPPIKATSSSSATVRMEKDVACVLKDFASPTCPSCHDNKAMT